MTTTHHEFYEQVETHHQLVERHQVFLEAYRSQRASAPEGLDVLDVGCGDEAILRQGILPGDRYYGADVKEHLDVELDHYARIDLDREDLADAFPGKTFDVVFCGEVIEHVFSPDRLLRQLASVLRPAGLLVLSTPNLAYWVNRILLPLGINPLFVENSAEAVLGRRLKALGQGNPTQGHVRLFTHRAMLDLLAREGWTLLDVKSTPVWNLPGDRLVCRYAPKLAPVNTYLLRPPTT